MKSIIIADNNNKDIVGHNNIHVDSNVDADDDVYNYDSNNYNKIDINVVNNYKNNYKDLQHLTNEEAIKHYFTRGIFENRKFFYR